MRASSRAVLEQFDARVLSDTQDQYTVEIVGGSQEIDRFLKRVAGITDVITLVRSGAMAVSRGGPPSSEAEPGRFRAAAAAAPR